LDKFSKLDDIDILSAMKIWQNHSDFVLSQLCTMILNRKLLNIKLKKKHINSNTIQTYIDKLKKKHPITDQEAQYFVFSGEISNKAYDGSKQNIHILKKSGKITDVAKASDHLNLVALSKTVTKYYICYPKDSF